MILPGWLTLDRSSSDDLEYSSGRARTVLFYWPPESSIASRSPVRGGGVEVLGARTLGKRELAAPSLP
jgi:hypothetical protein